MFRLVIGTWVLLLVHSGVPWAHAADRDSLLQYIPESANAVGAIRVKDILATPRARREEWSDAQRERFLAGAAVFPPTVERILSAWSFRPAVPEAAWSVAAVMWPEDVPMSAVAAREGSSAQRIAGKLGVASGRNAYFVQLESRVLGIARLGSRQDVARWVRSTESAENSKLSPYLTAIAESPAHIALGVDVEEMFDAERVGARLAASPSLRGKDNVVPALSDLIVNMQGVRLDVMVSEKIDATVTLDFRSDPSGLEAFIKPLFLDVLGDLGASVDDFEEGRVRVEGTAVTISAELSDEALRRVLSVFTLPHPSEADEQRVSPRTVRTSTDQRASQRYFKTVTDVLDDLERMNRRAKDYSKTATWHDNFAKKIDNLPAAGVDKELLRHGASISSKLRALAASLRGLAVEVNVQEQSITYNSTYDPGWVSVNVWGGVGYKEPSYQVESNLERVRENQAAAIAVGAKEREQIWQMINDERTQMTSRMSGISGGG